MMVPLHMLSPLAVAAAKLGAGALPGGVVGGLGGVLGGVPGVVGGVLGGVSAVPLPTAATKALKASISSCCCALAAAMAATHSGSVLPVLVWVAIGGLTAGG